MDQDWQRLCFLHWGYSPEHVQRLLPEGLTVDTFDGRAWVGMVPFLLRVRLPHGPAIPWLGVFPEVNVRTYVRGPGGAPGVWFLSLDAPRQVAIWCARALYHLPYCHAAVDASMSRGVRRCVSHRLSPPPRGASSACSVVVGDLIPSGSETELERFLTARWRLYARLGRGLGTARVAHAPWGLHRAVADSIDADLLVACGLHEPQDPPLVHACDDVRASFTRLTRCA